MTALVWLSPMEKVAATNSKRPENTTSSMIVSVAAAMPSAAPPVGFESAKSSGSSPSIKRSPKIGTWKVFTVSPSAKVSVPCVVR